MKYFVKCLVKDKVFHVVTDELHVEKSKETFAPVVYHSFWQLVLCVMIVFTMLALCRNQVNMLYLCKLLLLCKASKQTDIIISDQCHEKRQIHLYKTIHDHSQH